MEGKITAARHEGPGVLLELRVLAVRRWSCAEVMAPKKNQNKPKATAAKAKVKASAAKSKMHKPRLQPMRVKQEGSKTPPRTKNKPEMDVDDSAGPAASGTLGFARGTISALLTSLKCQAKSAKKISQEDKESAQKTLEDRRV